ncbi:MAG: hypothetical protein Kow0068_14030 [Marinilabiliales bacterium]
MKFNLLNIILLLSIISLYGQNDDYSDFITTSSGLKYKINEKGRGVKAENGDKVTVHYVGKFTNGNIFDSSVERKQPFSFILGQGQVIKGWDEGIAYLHQGDKATFVIPPELGYGDKAKGNIPANSTLVFDVEILNVMKIPKVEAYDTTNVKPVVTEDGLRFYLISEKHKKANKPKAGERVLVHYTGYFRDGKIFDSSVMRGEPIKIEVGANQVIQGWEKSLTMMKKGDKARILIPYELAYGEKGYPPVIPAKTDLIFDMELVDILPEIKIEPFDIKGKKKYKTESGLEYYIVKETNGEKVQSGQTVKVNYTGYLEDGKIFDSSVKRDVPFSFPVGMGRVIKGWDEGIQLMKVGEKFRFIIPPNLAYGDKGVPPTIPGNATLIFDVELIDIYQ